MIQNLIKIICSLLISGIIGLERESNDKAAGLRTCMLVCLIGTMVTIISLVLSKIGTMDVSRLPAYSIAGMGFLGSGIIIGTKKGKVEGVTTATLLWVLITLGILIGIGEFGLSFICGLVIYFILKLKHIEIWLNNRRH